MAINFDRFRKWVERRFDDVKISNKEIRIHSVFADDTNHHLWLSPSGGKKKRKMGVFHCFKTDRKGSLVNFVQLIDHCDREDALAILKGEPTVRDLEQQLEEFFAKQEPVVEEPPPPDLLLPTGTYLIDELKNRWWKEKAEEYLAGRKIPTAGLYICTELPYKSRIIIPYYDKKGKLIYWNGRHIFPQAKIRYLGPPKEVGVGKCFARGTLVLMYDGSVLPVEEIKEGDLLMGPDSRPRRVSGLSSGMDLLYLVRPVKGQSFIVNGNHILTLNYNRYGGRKVSLSVLEYLAESKTYKRNLQLYRADTIEWPEAPTPILPYIFGLWLGDGTSKAPALTNTDQIVLDAWFAEAHRRNLRINIENNSSKGCASYHMVKHTRHSQERSLTEDLRSLDVFGRKHIPSCYLNNSTQIRLDVLAGFLDTDGSLSNNCFEYITKHSDIAIGVSYLARSLGFACYYRKVQKRSQTGFVGEYYRGFISGDVDKIPVRIQHKKPRARRSKKNVLVTGFSVESCGVGDYFGFSVDQDHLFLLGDFTVVHNSDVVYVPGEWPQSGNLLHLCEGEFNAISLKLSGLAAAACGGKNMNDKQAVMLADYRLCLCLDRDKAGKVGTTVMSDAISLVQMTSKYKEKLFVVRPPKPYKDWNEMYVKEGSVIVHHFIKKYAKPISYQFPYGAGSDWTNFFGY